MALVLTVVAVGLLVPLTVDASTRRGQLQQVASPASSISPEGTSTAVTGTVTPIQYTVHVVKAGETLTQIAQIYGVSIHDIVETNRLSNPNLLHIGQQLTIPVDGNAVSLVPTITPSIIPAVTAEVTSAEGSSTQATMLCPDTTVVIPLMLPADPIRMVVVADQLFLLADGDLYRIPLENISGSEPVLPINLMPPGRIVGKYTIGELVYITVDERSGDLLLLDKTNDIYRYSVTRQWEMAFPAAQVPGQFPDPQYLSIQVADSGVYALDSDLSRIWVLRDGVDLPQVQFIDPQLLTAEDMVLSESTAPSPTFFVLMRDGSLMRFLQRFQNYVAKQNVKEKKRPWPAQLFKVKGDLFAIDGEARRIVGIDPNSQQVVQDITFRLPNMQRLRSALIQDDTVYGLAGRNLYIADLHTTSECPEVVYDNNYYFAGVNLLELRSGFQLPFPNTILPDRPRSYPGARRLYRYGIHEGLDLYQLDSSGLHIGSPVFSIADGVIVRADNDFVEMSPVEYEAAITQSTLEHRTPLDLVDSFLGRQVHILHSPGVESRYAHLSSIAAGIEVGAPITHGTSIGNVGVSGTSSGAYGTTDGAHLHVEIWINGRYLGQGLSLYETVRLWKVLFSDPQ